MNRCSNTQKSKSPTVTYLSNPPSTKVQSNPTHPSPLIIHSTPSLATPSLPIHKSLQSNPSISPSPHLPIPHQPFLTRPQIQTPSQRSYHLISSHPHRILHQEKIKNKRTRLGHKIVKCPNTNQIPSAHRGKKASNDKAQMSTRSQVFNWRYYFSHVRMITNTYQWCLHRSRSEMIKIAKIKSRRDHSNLAPAHRFTQSKTQRRSRTLPSRHPQPLPPRFTPPLFTL